MSQQSTFFSIQDVLDEASQEVRSTVPTGKTLRLQGHSHSWYNGRTPRTFATDGSVNLYVVADDSASTGQDKLPAPPSDGATRTVENAKTALRAFAREFANPEVEITNALSSTCEGWTAKFADPPGEPTDDDPREGVRAVVLMYNVDAEPAPKTNGVPLE